MANHTTTRTADSSLRRTARIAGWLYLAIIVSGIFAQMFVRASLVVPGNATATANNITASEGLFRLGIAADFVMILSDIALALAFYVLFRAVSNSLSLLAAFFRLTQATILGINLLMLFIALQLMNGAGYLTVLGVDESNALALLFMDAHATGYRIALVFFAISIAILGYLILKSDYLPRVLGILLAIAAVGYLVDSFANFLMPNYADYEAIFTVVVFAPAIVAELSLGLWLLIKGVKVPQQDEHIAVKTTPVRGTAG